VPNQNGFQRHAHPIRVLAESTRFEGQASPTPLSRRTAYGNGAGCRESALNGSASTQRLGVKPRHLPAWLLAGLLVCQHGMAATLYHAQGEIAGEPGTDSVLLQSRLTASEELNELRGISGAAGVARFIIDTGTDSPAAIATPWIRAEPANDFIVRQQVKGLRPGTRYRYRLEFGRDAAQTQLGPARWFKTLPGTGGGARLSFLMFNCMGWGQYMDGYGDRQPYAGADKMLGYPTLVQAQKYGGSDFFICAGDSVYYDTPRPATARTLPEMRAKWQQQFSMPRMVQFIGSMGSYWMKDDHDFRYDDADLSGPKEPSAELGIRVFKEQMPVVPREDFERVTYRTVRASAQVQLWFLEGRDYRSPNQMDDGPDKTIWGAKQRAWLQRTLGESDAAWKLIITPTPMVGPDMDRKRDNHTNSRGFRHEGNQFFAWLKQSGVKNVVLFTGDRHWQYHSVHPTGVSEFACGSLSRENAVGDPPTPGTEGSTDPQRLIDQKFVTSKQDGGFLRVLVDDAATLRVEIINQEGTRLYAHEATPAK
jgi:alkaline phosphatase/alkaline phosphatase D